MNWQPFYSNRLVDSKEIGISVQDILDISDAFFVCLMNYMVDMEWLLNECDFLCRTETLVLHGQKSFPPCDVPNLVVAKVDLGTELYGTHHSKIIMVYSPRGLRVAIMTANLIHSDFNEKRQGIFVQDFPLRNSDSMRDIIDFEVDLRSYLERIELCSPRARQCFNDKVLMTLSKYDFSSANVALIPSVPGRHATNSRVAWGHLKLRKILATHGVSVPQGGRIVMQCSSLGTMGKDEKFIDELAVSMGGKRSVTSSSPSSSTTTSARMDCTEISIVWPSVDFVRISREGYAAGGSIPCESKVCLWAHRQTPITLHVTHTALFSSLLLKLTAAQ